MSAAAEPVPGDTGARCAQCGNEDPRLIDDVPDLRRRYCDVCGAWWSDTRWPSQMTGAEIRRDDA